jgi:hypothetical protein
MARPAFQSGSLNMYTTVFPSGDSCGSTTRGSVAMSIRDIGRRTSPALPGAACAGPGPAAPAIGDDTAARATAKPAAETDSRHADCDDLM